MRVAVPASAVPDRVLRGVALATIAAVGASGAGVALAGATAPMSDRRADEQDAQDGDDEAAARTADPDDPRAEDQRTTDRARRAGDAADPDAATSVCDPDTGGLGAVEPHVRAAATFLACANGSPPVLGVAGRSHTSDHPRGLAVDFVVDRATGDALAARATRDREAPGVSYVIWRQRIDTGDGFRAMPDRGGATANHLDHVHVSFEPSTDVGDPAAC